MSEDLQYRPMWYHLGDPDNPLLAVVYGTVALSTIWVLEYISSRILYSTADGILLSDAAAQVTYSSSGLPEFIKWMIKRGKTRRKLCRRALFGLLLRYLVLCVDIGILFMSLPREIVVFESEVGTSQLTYNVRGVTNPLDQFISCKIDNIKYRGFTPQVARQICVSGRALPTDLPSFSRVLDGYLFYQSSDVQGMSVVSTRTLSTFIVTHSLRYVLDEDDDTGRTLFGLSRKELLPVPDNFLEQAVSAFQQNQNYRGRCDPIELNSENGDSIYIQCRLEPGISNITSDIRLMSFMMSVGTQKIPSENPRPVGKLNRPRLCILPALILLAGLCAIAGMLILKRGTQDLAFKQWAHASRTAKKENVENPLFSEEQELELQPDFTVHTVLQSESDDDEIGTRAVAQNA